MTTTTTLIPGGLVPVVDTVLFADAERFGSAGRRETALLGWLATEAKGSTVLRTSGGSPSPPLDDLVRLVAPLPELAGARERWESPDVLAAEVVVALVARARNRLAGVAARSASRPAPPAPPDSGTPPTLPDPRPPPPRPPHQPSSEVDQEPRLTSTMSRRQSVTDVLRPHTYRAHCALLDGPAFSRAPRETGCSAVVGEGDGPGVRPGACRRSDQAMEGGSPVPTALAPRSLVCVPRLRHEPPRAVRSAAGLGLAIAVGIRTSDPAI